MSEEWRKIVDTEYEVSSFGRVRRIGGKPLKPTAQKCGMHYLVVDLHRKQKYIHLLVCESFHGPRPPSMVARHLDGNVNNCRSDNLEWGTHLQNQHDRVTHGTNPAGVNNGRSVLTPTDVTELRKLLEEARQRLGYTPKGMVRDLAAKYGVHRGTISRAFTGERWKNV